MSSEMDKAMLAMSLTDDDDAPYNLPDLPQYYATERNSNSLIGRLLNPTHQNMAKLILEMPRKWQKYNRVRGIALTKERFQFIFNHAHDLEEVLEKGFHTFDDWGLAVERWVERPPPGFLQNVQIWMQIKNIPVNHYTKPAITELGGLIGHVVEVAFDPDKPQRQDYVRVKILLDVSKPLKKSRILNLPGGGQTTILYFYEKVQKRCTHCQRLTHAKDRCPFLAHQQDIPRNITPNVSSSQQGQAHLTLSESDPLYGVLNENQVGINPLTGRPKINPEVLQEMRNYLLASNNEDRLIREQRVISSVKEAENDPITRKTILQLEPPPIFTTNLNKGKGIVFGYDTDSSSTQSLVKDHQSSKLMAGAIAAGRNPAYKDLDAFSRLSLPYSSSSTGTQFTSSSTEISGASLIKGKRRRRPGKFTRLARSKERTTAVAGSSKNPILKEAGQVKRKAEVDLGGASKVARNNASKTVPTEGLSNV